MNNIKLKAEDLKGNLLKYIFTRIDYEDVIEIQSKTIKKIKNKFPESKIAYRMLKEQDFSFYDPNPIIELPKEIIETTKCVVIFFKEEDLIVEINQYFTRLIYKVDREKYNNYKTNIMNKLEGILDIINDEDIKIRRSSINKIDEAFFGSIPKMKKIFKSNILRFNLLNTEMDWTKPSNRLKTETNFGYKDYEANYASIIENVRIYEKRYFRIFLSYEVYSKENINSEKDIKTVITNLNKCCDELFISSLTTTGYKKLKNKERISEYEVD
ncbi:hypothetical protein AL713_02295 [Clostridium botulinum]|uniref:hypothetical protein n=1 Tax=Clostridium botulinum TaxID=1491 RepID=UPI00099C573C|nr:hypothetical protein [Clostridium botulinum]OPD34209.1 hypothetical protein AL713_02295 [Clostridium botulinum]